MNAPKPPRRLSARRDDPLPSLPAPNSGGLSFFSSSTSRSRFAALAEKKPDSYSSSSMGGVGSSGGTATPHKVWLGSLPSTLTESELRECLACFGTIQSLFFKPEQPGVAALPADQPQQNKKARGWAFVSYATAEEAQALIKAVDGKPPDAVFPVAGSSLVAPGTAPPVEARLANASKNNTSTASLSTSSAGDSRTVFSEEEPHSREKLLALAFFSPSHKPSSAGRASSLAPQSTGASAADGGNSSSIRCSSHPRVPNSSITDKADESDTHVGCNTAVSGAPAELCRQTAGPLRGGAAPPPSHSFVNNAALRGQNNNVVGQSVTEQQQQQLKLAAEETPPPPGPTSFPPPPAGSGNLGPPQFANTDKSGVTAVGAPQKNQEAAATTSTGEAGGATTAAPSPGAGASNRAAALTPPSAHEQQQQPSLDGSGAGAAGAAQRGKRVYGGLHAAAFPPLSAAAATTTGPSSGRPQPQQNGPEGPGLPSLWEVYWTPDTHQPYYYNAVSKHVQWERPLPPRDYVEQYGSPMTEELGPPAPLIPGITRGVVAGKGGAVVGPQGSNLFVFHLPPEWSEQTFLRHFAPFGNVVSCKIQLNAQTGKRGGFGFVSYDNPASAIASIRMLNGFAACGKMLKVQLKKGEEHLLPPDLQQQQQQQQQQQHQHAAHPPPAAPLGFTWSAAA